MSYGIYMTCEPFWYFVPYWSFMPYMSSKMQNNRKKMRKTNDNKKI